MPPPQGSMRPAGEHQKGATENHLPMLEESQTLNPEVALGARAIGQQGEDLTNMELTQV